MKKILIFNLKRNGDIFSSAKLAAAFKEMSKCYIAIVVYDEYISAASTCTPFDKIFTIERSKILQILCSEIIPIHSAFNIFSKNLMEFSGSDWDLIINYSNDKISAYLCSMIPAKNIIGVHFSDKNNPIMNTRKEEFLNYLYSDPDFIAPNFNELAHSITGVIFPIDQLYSKKLNQDIVYQNFIQLKKNKNLSRWKYLKIVAIQTKTSLTTKDISPDVLIKIIKHINNDPELLAIIITANSNDEIDLARKIISKSNTKTIAISADFPSVVSILTQCDLLITPDTSIKHLAGLTKTPSIELANHLDFKHTSTTKSDIIYFSKKHSSRKIIALTYNILFDLPIQNIIEDDTSSCSFSIKQNNNYVDYFLIDGIFPVKHMICYQINKAFIYSSESTEHNFDSFCTSCILDEKIMECIEYIEECTNEISALEKMLQDILKKSGELKRKELIYFLGLLYDKYIGSDFHKTPLKLSIYQIESINNSEEMIMNTFSTLQKNITILIRIANSLRDKLQKKFLSYGEYEKNGYNQTIKSPTQRIERDNRLT